MFKTAIFFVILFGHIYGYLENAQPRHEVRDSLTSRIVGGQEAPEGYAKYMVALVNEHNVKQLVCGGSIITKRHILSAAHCIQPFVFRGQLSPQLKGVIGSNYWNSSNIIKFFGFVMHPGFNWGTLKNDIGILFTAKEIVFNDRVGPIPLNYNWVDGEVETFVTGWGRLSASGNIPYRLQLLRKSTLSPEECHAGIKNASSGWTPPYDPALEICTLHSKGHGMCNGDSGSALVLRSNRQLVGLVSWGFPCARGAPDVFVRISAFREFLELILGKHL